MSYPSGPVRLADLIAEHKLLWCYCAACGRERDVDPAGLPLPPDMPVPLVRHRLKCGGCGSRNVDARPELYPGGIERMREIKRQGSRPLHKRGKET